MPPLPSPFDRLLPVASWDQLVAVAPAIIAAVVLVGGVVAVVLALKRRDAPKRPPAGRVPYQIADANLTEAEQLFFRVLRGSVNPQYFVFAKVRLGDLINTSLLWPWIAKSKFNQNYVDFVVCSPEHAPLLVVEFDDPAEPLRDRIDRDDFINTALRAARLPVLRVEATAEYSRDDLRARVHDHLQSALGRR